MISVIGAGAWGSALYYAIKQVRSDVLITSRKKRNIEGFVDLNKALKNEYILISIASQSIKDFFKRSEFVG